MKVQLNHKAKAFLLVLALFFLTWTAELKACNLSSMSLINYSFNAGTGVHTYDFQLCIGGGVTGATLGGDGDTFDIAFGLYSAVPIVTVASFSPATITNPFNSCSLLGMDAGAVPFAPFNTQGTIFYQWNPLAPGCGQGYTCVTTTPLCGNVVSLCQTYQIQTMQALDSITVFGPEGAGNPGAGCFGLSDMALVFSGGLPVEWLNWSTTLDNKKAKVEWEISDEAEAVEFEVARSADMKTWTVISHGERDAYRAQNGGFQYVDEEIPFGRSLYRITAHTVQGEVEVSPLMEVVNAPDEALVWTSLEVSRANEQLQAELFSSNKKFPLRISLINAEGKSVFTNELNPSGEWFNVEIKTDKLASGLYFLNASQGENNLTKKFLLP